MTAIFDEKSRKILTSEIRKEELEYHGQQVKDLSVVPISKELARMYISSFHYSKTFPDSTLYCYGGFWEEQIVGVICYGMGCGKSQYTSVLPEIQNGQYIELTRLWCMSNAPKNTESKIISESLKQLPKEIKLVISFSDSGQGHCGIIYQATNWYYVGKNDGGGIVLINKDGIVKHPRLIGIYKMRHPEYKDMAFDDLCNLLGYTKKNNSFKYKYVYLRGNKAERKSNYNKIKNMIQEYPKCNHKVDELSDEEILEEDNKTIRTVKQKLW